MKLMRRQLIHKRQHQCTHQHMVHHLHMTLLHQVLIYFSIVYKL